MKRPSSDYNWTCEEPTEEGFFVALKSNTMDPVLVTVEERSFGECRIGAHAFIGPNDNCTYGNPQIRPMREDFAMWARVPDPLKEF